MFSSEGLSEKYVHVNNCGRQILSKSDTVTIRPHGRMDFHLLYIFSGVCHAVMDGKNYTVCGGNAVLFRPYEAQEYRFYKKDKSESLWIHFTGVGCEEYLQQLGIFDKRVLNVGKSAELISTFEAMIRTKSLPDDVNEDVCDGYLFLALALIAKSVKYGREKIKRFSEISVVVEYMSKDFKNILSIDEYAKMCHLSKSRFEHVFKENTGETPLGYVYKLRIREAKRLLENTDMRIARIAEEIGFYDANYFTRVFKKHTGVAPLKFRELCSEFNEKNIL